MQLASLLGYGEPEVLELFKNTLPSRLYWVIFPIEDLRQAVETAKRILIKEKIDRQLTGQSISTSFMSIQDNTGCNKKDIKTLFESECFGQYNQQAYCPDQYIDHSKQQPRQAI